MIRMLLTLGLALSVVSVASAELKTKKITYKHGDLECHGYLAWDDSVKGPRPGVLVVHEWWGLNDYARGRADQLAKLGYIALAADMYGEGKVAKHPMEAGQMATKVRSSIKDWRARAQLALETLQAQPECDKNKCASIGYCFGGSTSLQLAFSGANVQAVASFHGALMTPSDEEVKQTKAAILVCNGANDTFIPEKAINSFRAALDKGGAKYEFVNYPGAVHSFTVPDAGKHNNPGMQYNQEADEDSWKKMLKLFSEKLGK